MGEMDVDSGQVRRAKSTTIGYLPQEIAPAGDGSVLGISWPDFPKCSAWKPRWSSWRPRWPRSRTEPPRISWIATATSSINTSRWGLQPGGAGQGDSWGAWPSRPPRPTSRWRALRRLADARGLGRLLLQSPDLLLLDEPTNHLDLESLQWLEDFLGAYEGTVVIISTTVFPEPRRGPHRGVGAGTLHALRRGLRRTTRHRSSSGRNNWRRPKEPGEQIEKMERFIRKFRYKATKARQVQSRIKQLDKIERVEMIRAPKRIHFRFPQPGRSGRW